MTEEQIEKRDAQLRIDGCKELAIDFARFVLADYHLVIPSAIPKKQMQKLFNSYVEYKSKNK